MNTGKLATALTITFIVSVIVLFAELLFVLRRRRYFRSHSSQQPPTPTSKPLLHFFKFKSQQTRVEPSEPPKQKRDGIYSPDDPGNDPVIDVFKMLEVNGTSRVLCTIKEDDREEVESMTSMSVVDSLEIPATEVVPAAKVDVDVEGAKTVLSSPCDSPVFFTPVGSPVDHGMGSEFVSPVLGDGCAGGR